MTILTRSWQESSLELRGRDGRTVVGIAAPFDSPTTIHESARGTFSEVIRRGAFARTIAERGATKVKFLALHDSQRLPLGRATLLREDAAGLYMEARVSQTQAGDEVLELIRDGALDGLSIGFTVPSGGETFDARAATRDLTEIRLHEVSAVPWPAYADALVTGVRSHPTPQAVPAYRAALDPELLLLEHHLLNRGRNTR